MEQEEARKVKMIRFRYSLPAFILALFLCHYLCRWLCNLKYTFRKSVILLAKESLKMKGNALSCGGEIGKHILHTPSDP